MDIRFEDFVRKLLQRRDIIHYPESAAVGADHQVVEMLLDDHVMDRRMRKVVLNRKPVLPIIKRDINGILRSHEKQSLPHRVFMDPVAIAEHTLRDIRAERFPVFSVICGLVDERVAVVHLVEIDCDVGRARLIP